ncbi:MAG: PIN domain-containing protein [Vicinamibacteria bacterium]
MTAILVDTSIWRKYFAGVASARGLGVLLDEGAVLVHPFVLGELALGGLSERQATLFSRLPEARVQEHAEVLAFINHRRLEHKGIGWVDAHLLASALVEGAFLWSADRALAMSARSLGVAFNP